MSTQFFQRPSAAYAGEAGLPNRTKYNDDSAASPRRPISSTKVDGDINYLIDAVNALYDTAVSGVVADNSITNAKLRDSGACSVIGRAANSSGSPADISATTNGTVLVRKSNQVQFSTIPAGAFETGSIATSDLADTAVSFGKIQNVNTGVVLGRSNSGAGSVEALTLGSGLSISAGVLNTVTNRTMVVLTSGTSWSVPAGVSQVKYRMVGGGGQGGGSNQTNGAASGGGGGEYAEGYLTVTPGGSVSYSIGAGGTGGTNTSDGGNGGNTTLDTITVVGGSGGVRMQAANSGVPGGAGGTGGSGTAGVRIAGQYGSGSVYNSTNGTFQGGFGGNSQLGYGGAYNNGFSGARNGDAGQNYGGGGAGGFGSTGVGGVGAQGVIILEH